MSRSVSRSFTRGNLERRPSSYSQVKLGEDRSKSSDLLLTPTSSSRRSVLHRQSSNKCNRSVTLICKPPSDGSLSEVSNVSNSNGNDGDSSSKAAVAAADSSKIGQEPDAAASQQDYLFYD